MTETQGQAPTLNDFIQRLDGVTINGVPLTLFHKLRGTLSGEVYDSNGERLGTAQEEGGVWGNVAEHGAMSMLVSDVLSEILELPEEERGYVNLTSWLEDSGKKTERMWQRAIEDATVDPKSDHLPELIQGEMIIDSPSRQQIMLGHVSAMEEEEFRELGLSQKANQRILQLMKLNVPPSDEGHGDDLAARIRWFTDAIVHGSEIVPIQERFDRLEADPVNGKRNIAFSDSFKDKYGGKSLYEVQRNLGARYEREFAARLGGVEISQVYSLIRNGVSARIASARMPVMPKA